MHDKQKVTLYIPPELHRKLKIRGAVDAEPMSAIAQRAIEFYLEHAEVVAEVEETTKGKTHRVYTCPECEGNFVLRSGEAISLKNQPKVLEDGEITSALESSQIRQNREQEGQEGEEELVPC
jgi:hypothetical protein